MIITLQALIFFRASLLSALDRLLRPYYKRFSLTFGRDGDVSDDEDSEEQVFAEYDDERGVVFFPPMYVQRYAAVSDCLMDERWCGKLEKVVDIGYHDMSFIKYLKEVPGVKCILGVDLESIPLRCSSDLIGCDDYIPKRENPLQITLFKGNAADPDYRLIGCDAVVSIEMIEHMLPHDLERLIHTVFGFIKPLIAIFTTPNGDFNVLFKSLEKNGLRRLDHFFEWSREQFNDWCTNIVTRYPNYSVSCKGIGPGPPETLHLGCCSQMALFVNNEYSKQQDLNINSLALVSKKPSPESLSNVISSWESCDVIPNESKMIAMEPSGVIDNLESYTKLNSERQSSITLVLTPSYTSETHSFHDKTSQCNLDNEVGRNYMMFDYEQMCFDLVVPRKKLDSRVYVIEDVNSRLNCTTLQVKKFSKTTQNLMAKHRVDSLTHTREVVDEIRHLTKMLNFNRKSLDQPANGANTWCNINWGENAPYWNQYYKVVREYNYPFENKSEECRILELISDEINRQIDIQFDDELSMDMNRLEIPIKHLMSVVEHITDDMDKVKDLLEWNGYEVSGDIVVHSRLVVDNASLATQDQDDWQESDTYSDWDSTDIRSTSQSDGSATLQDYHARCLHRALDQKVKKLRSMLTADEDITTELDQVVCRLMKLALRTSRGRQTPPPTRWMQCKLLDLLTLTEKSIERRKRHLIESFPIKAINFDISEDRIALDKIIEDDTALKIVDKYTDLEEASDDTCEKYHFLDNLEDNVSASSGDFAKDYDYIEAHSPSLYSPEHSFKNAKIIHAQELCHKMENTLGRTQAWLEDDIEVVPYPNHDLNNFDNSSGDADQSFANVPKYYKKKYNDNKKYIEVKCVVCNKSHSKTKCKKDSKEKCGKTKLTKKESRKSSSYNNLGKNTCHQYVSVHTKGYKIKPRRKHYKVLYPTVTKPIPPSLIELCHSKLTTENMTAPYYNNFNDVTKEIQRSDDLQNSDVAATKQSLLIGIVTDDVEEVVALRRTIGIDANIDSLDYGEEKLIRSISNTFMTDTNYFNEYDVATENVDSQTIFLYDIDEPTTSKGIRHTAMDVQCGPDTGPAFSTLSATTSLSRVPKMFSAGIQIEGSSTDTYIIKNADCSTSTNTSNNQNTHKSVQIQARERSLGIKIKDSDISISKQRENPNSTTVDVKINADCEFTDDTTPQYEPDERSAEFIIRPIGSHSMVDIRRMNNYSCTYTHDIYDYKPRALRDLSNDINIKDINCNGPKQPDGSHSPTRTKIKTKNTDFEICSYGVLNTNAPTREMKYTSLKTEDSNQNILNNIENSKDSAQPPLHVETHLLSTPTELEIYNVASEIYAGSFLKPSSDSENCYNETSLSLPNSKNSAPGKKAINRIKPRLSLGGIQVHSFREKQMSEDIMYQGQWQKNLPKVLTRRKIFNAAISKKISATNLKKKYISKEKIPVKNNSTPVRRCSVLRSTNIANIKQETNVTTIKTTKKTTTIMPTRASVAGASMKVTNTIRKPFRNVLKVPSKITMSSAPTKTPRSAFVVKKPSITSSLTIRKYIEAQSKVTNKSYLPSYLKRRISKAASESINKNKTNTNLHLSDNSGKSNIDKKKPTKSRSKTLEFNRDLLRFQAKAPVPNFVVLHNEIEKKISAKQLTKSLYDVKRRDTGKQRHVSPTSANSSSCSSPNSIATVRSLRPKNVANRRYSLSSYKMNTAKSESDSTTPDKNKKSTKKSKNIKTPDKVTENKENIPQTSKQNNVGIKESDNSRGTFKGQKKDIFTVQVMECPPLLSNTSRNRAQKSNVNIHKGSTHSQSPSISKRISFKSDVSSPNVNEDEDSKISQTSDMVLVIEPPSREFHSNDESKKFEAVHVDNNELVSSWIDSHHIESEDTAAMRLLIDETLDFIDDPFDSTLIDSESFISSLEIYNAYNHNEPIDTVPSINFETVTTNDENPTLQSDIEHVNWSFEIPSGEKSVISLNDTRLTVTDFDMLSFKSVTSTSRLSEYLSADNEFSSSQGKLLATSPNNTSVREIFERKDLPICSQKPTSALATQAFSGFSLDADHIPGDQADSINVVDSETGSFAVNVNRQTTSEELFVAARSSNSFESCLLDEDSVVPNWLFQIISQQESVMNELEPPPQLMVPVAEPMFDDNGNVVEGPGAGAGAGDGRGIHSDSQDSSGRGTSVSSSETSSGIQSEGDLMEPTGLAQFELLQDAVEGSGLALPSEPTQSLGNVTGSIRPASMETGAHSLSRGESRRRPRERGGSDVDADVSSLDTDEPPDSSDY